MSGQVWVPFERAWPQSNKGMARLDDASRVEYARRINDGLIKIWKNNRYQVQETCAAVLRETKMLGEEWPDLVWLSVRRLDRAALKDWRDLQRIKNELVGHRHEGLELYPLSKRIVDSSNQYHLWVLAQPDTVFPFGYPYRDVLTDPAQARLLGAMQRGFAPEHLTIIQEEPE